MYVTIDSHMGPCPGIILVPLMTPLLDEQVHTPVLRSILPTRKDIILPTCKEDHTPAMRRLVGAREARADKCYEREG